VLGAWRNRRWITFAAIECYGWTASGHYSSWEDLERGMQIYREAGGANAILANVALDLARRPETGNLGEVAHVSLIGWSDEVRQRLKRIEQIGFDEILVVSPVAALDDIERVRDFLQPIRLSQDQLGLGDERDQPPFGRCHPNLPDHGPPAAMDRRRLAGHHRSNRRWSDKVGLALDRRGSGALGQVEDRAGRAERIGEGHQGAAM
jgi:hypothetical protein